MIADAVRAELARRKMTVAALARLAHVEQPTLHAWLAGRRGIGLARAESVIRALGLVVRRRTRM